VHAAGMGRQRNEYRVLATKEHIASETWASVAISTKCILMRCNRRVWTVSICLRVGAIGEPLCEICNKYSDSIQGEEIP
jgi:hypothetical protein